MQLITENVIAQGGDGLVLYGGRSKSDGRIVFPMPEGAEAERYDRVPLKSEGKLWSYTVQRFPPKNPPFLGPNAPDTFKPFALGYVELEDQVIVETRIVTDDFDALTVGLPMKLTTTEYMTNEAGSPVGTFAFEPIASRS
ncbi:MAG: OB-fold domain-containing protein [Pseudomonadota bacterium]